MRHCRVRSGGEIERFLESVVLDDLGQTFVRLAVEFLLERKELEDQVQGTLEVRLKYKPVSQLIPTWPSAAIVTSGRASIAERSVTAQAIAFEVPPPIDLRSHKVIE
jgi:hypothetical protein